MSNVMIELDSAGIRELLRSDEVSTFVGEVATAKQKQCGPGYGVKSYKARTRAVVRVFTETPKVAKADRKNNTLLRAFGSDVKLTSAGRRRIK